MVCDFIRWQIFLIEECYPHTQLVCVTAIAQELVSGLLPNKKSGGCR